MNNLWVSLVRGCSCLKERSILEHFDDSVCIRTQTEPSPLPACLACSSCFNRHVHMKCSQLRVTSQRYQQDRHRAGNSRLVRLARFQRRRLCSAVMPALALKHGDVLDDQLTGSSLPETSHALTFRRTSIRNIKYFALALVCLQTLLLDCMVQNLDKQLPPESEDSSQVLASWIRTYSSRPFLNKFVHLFLDALPDATSCALSFSYTLLLALQASGRMA